MIQRRRLHFHLNMQSQHIIVQSFRSFVSKWTTRCHVYSSDVFAFQAEQAEEKKMRQANDAKDEEELHLLRQFGAEPESPMCLPSMDRVCTLYKHHDVSYYSGFYISLSLWTYWMLVAPLLCSLLFLCCLPFFYYLWMCIKWTWPRIFHSALFCVFAAWLFFFLHFDIALENDFSSDLVICHGLERVFAHVYHDVSSFETTHQESSPVCANKMW